MKLKIKIIQYSLIVWAFFLFLFISASASAATHYVSPNGSASWASCTNINTPCSLSTANANADDDDIVYLRDGSFKTTLNPTNSGSSGHPITFKKYAGETPTFTNNSNYGVLLSGNSYIVLDGLSFTGNSTAYRQVYLINSSNHNEIKNCTFSGTKYNALNISSDYNYVHNNTFDPGGDLSPSTGLNDIVAISGNYNRFIDNTMSEGGNHAFVWITGGSYNAIQGNTITMSRSYYDSYRSSVNNTASEIFNLENGANYNLVEDNTITFFGTPYTSTGSEQFPFQLDGVSYNIIRNNVINNCKGIVQLFNNWWNRQCEYNVYYNNTFYKVGNFYNGYGVWHLWWTSGGHIQHNTFINNLIDTYYHQIFRSGEFGTSTQIHDNLFSNNIMYNGIDAIWRFNGTSLTIDQAEGSYSNEFKGTITDDPKLIDPGSGDMTLESGSPAIDAGQWLTTITSASGSGTSFKVDNPYFFFEGISQLSLPGDVIKTSTGESATIENISGSTITVNSPISWTQGDGIALYYAGSAPDIGAKEYPSDGSAISSPKGLIIRVTQ